MPASRDKSQKIAFVYSNLYKIYRDGKEAAKSAQVDAPVPAPVTESEPVVVSRNVLKAEDAAALARPYQPVELIGKRVIKPSSIAPSPVQGLKENLQTLNDLQSRLRFMLKELEDLIKE